MTSRSSKTASRRDVAMLARWSFGRRSLARGFVVAFCGINLVLCSFALVGVVALRFRLFDFISQSPVLINAVNWSRRLTRRASRRGVAMLARRSLNRRSLAVVSSTVWRSTPFSASPSDILPTLVPHVWALLRHVLSNSLRSWATHGFALFSKRRPVLSPTVPYRAGVEAGRGTSACVMLHRHDESLQAFQCRIMPLFVYTGFVHSGSRARRHAR